MDLKKYLIDSFNFNSNSNKQILSKLQALKDKNETIKYVSHLINCQFKWMARIMQDQNAQKLDWWNPIYTIEEIEKKWDESVILWLNYIDSKTEKELLTEVEFIGFDGSQYAATPFDIALQLNYHSIHHRAQIQTIIRQQGITPDFIDYIGTKYRKLT